MRDLSLHILDIASNSVKAGAKNISVTVAADTDADTLAIVIGDDGCGIPKEMLERIFDPFTTSRKTRAVGMGLPLLKQIACDAGGTVTIDSTVGVGTTVTATFVLSSVDRLPLGDLTETIIALINGAPDIIYTVKVRCNSSEYVFDSGEAAQMMDGIPLSEPEVLMTLREIIKENLIFIGERI
jgi:anti-sigma regulatory factor (Ser/Thr protein kinase)